MTKVAYTNHTGLNADDTHYEIVICELDADGGLTELERRNVLGRETYGTRPQTPAGEDYWLGGWAMYGEPDAPATLAQQTTVAQWRVMDRSADDYRQVHQCVVAWAGVDYERTQELAGVRLPAYRNR